MKGTNGAAATGGEVDLHRQIRQLIVGARRTIARGVDVVQVRTNFEIGRHIVEREQQGEARASYGAALLQSVSKRLVNEFGNGFSKRNLELMRRFFVEYRVRYRIAQTVSAQLHIGDFRSHDKNYELQTNATADDAGMNDEGMNDADVPFTLSWSHYILLVGIANVSERLVQPFLQNVCRTLHLSAHAASYGNLPAAYAPAKRATASYFEPFKNAGGRLGEF